MSSFNATVVDRRDLTENLGVFRIRPDSGSVPAFQPGQYATLGLPASGKLLKRPYSITSAPEVKGYLEFFVAKVESGEFTEPLWKLPVGGRVWMSERAKGDFTIEDVPQDKNLVLVSTGTGIGPYMSILRTYRGQARWKRLVLINGARLSSDLGYAEELSQLAAGDPSMTYIPCVSREPSSSPWRGIRGRVQQVLESPNYERLTGSVLDPKSSHIFLCGNPDMIVDTVDLLESLGHQVGTKTDPG
ncbi:MAG: ferredoxin--NADP reductase, partial [Myxococcota bacterium]